MALNRAVSTDQRPPVRAARTRRIPPHQVVTVRPGHPERTAAAALLALDHQRSLGLQDFVQRPSRGRDAGSAIWSQSPIAGRCPLGHALTIAVSCWRTTHSTRDALGNLLEREPVTFGPDGCRVGFGAGLSSRLRGRSFEPGLREPHRVPDGLDGASPSDTGRPSSCRVPPFTDSDGSAVRVRGAPGHPARGRLLGVAAEGVEAPEPDR